MANKAVAAAPAAKRAPRKTLASVIGSAIGAIALLTMVPAEESGRKVTASIATDGSVAVRHVAGPQYLRAYLDAVGVPTACDGITKGVRLGQRYTEAQCATLLEAELIVHAEGVIACVPQLYGRDHQAPAAVSLAYNIGVIGFCGSTAAKLFRAGRWREGCVAFAPWNKGTVRGRKVLLPGLVKRRARETALCLAGL